MATTPQTLPPDTSKRRREPGYTPLVEFARVRNGVGLTSMDAAGRARFHPGGEPMWSLRREIISLEHFRANLAQLLLDQKTILPCTRQDWDDAAVCKHGRRWAEEETAKACRCEVLQRTSTV